jgi:hypothetical protein
MSYSGGLTANWNTLLQRGLNLLDATDPVACRQNIGAVATTDFGYGLGVAGKTISVDATATGGANKVVRTDGNGDLTTAGQLILGSSALASISRVTGANGTLDITNLGSGAFRLNNGTGIIQLVSGSNFQLTAAGANPSTITTSAGLDVGLTNGATGIGLTVTGGLNADSLSGAAISDSTTGTSSTIAASTKAVATAKTAAATAQTTAAAAQTTADNKLDLTTTSAQSVAGPITFNSGLVIGTQLISHSELVYTAHNGGTTGPSSIVQFGGATYFGLPGTTTLEAKNDYGSTGLDATGLFTAPIAGRYFYSYTYSGSASTTLTVYKNNGSSNAMRQRVGTGTQLSVTGSVNLTIAQTLWAALGVTSTLNANFNNIYIQLLL